MTAAEFKDLDSTLARLDDCDLGAWDRDFVDDMIRRVGKYGRDTHVSGKQFEQIERMKGQYL